MYIPSIWRKYIKAYVVVVFAYPFLCMRAHCREIESKRTFIYFPYYICCVLVDKRTHKFSYSLKVVTTVSIVQSYTSDGILWRTQFASILKLTFTKYLLCMYSYNSKSFFFRFEFSFWMRKLFWLNGMTCHFCNGILTKLVFSIFFVC